MLKIASLAYNHHFRDHINLVARNALLFSIPWFRVHIILLNDPGRLVSVHLMHRAFVTGWSDILILYELILVDSTDPIYIISRLGVLCSLYNWSLGIEFNLKPSWTYETVFLAHLSLSGSLIVSSLWHWAYWDIEVFVGYGTTNLVLDLNQLFGIHLSLASILCNGFGFAHISGYLGPGLWTSDSLGIVGSIRFIKPFYSFLGLDPFCYGVISSNHIVAGFMGTYISLWHISSRPGPLVYKLLSMGNVEEVLCSSIASVFFTTFINASLMWYGSVSSGVELYGPSRYHWDNGYFSLEVERRVTLNSSFFLRQAWEQVPEKLILYDYIGCNPSKGGLFRSGPILKGDGVVQNWLGHSIFERGSLALTIRRMPAFFETFPVLLIDQGGTVRADIPFRRAESRYSIEQTSVVIFFSRGLLNGTEYSLASVVKDYSRKAQFGEIFTFKRTIKLFDGVFRTSPRGWYSFSHIALALLFLLGHLWHACRAVFQDLWTGVTFIILHQVEYGRNEKLGDKTTSWLG